VSGPVGVVLAGGRGSRLGGEGKAGLDLAGRPLLAYVLEALTGALDEVAIAAKASTELPGASDGTTVHVPGRAGRVPLWTEPDEPHHPLTGLRHALRRAEGRAVLACAVDLPLITPSLVELIATADADGAPAVVPVTGTRLQPLLARYEPAALATLDAAGPDAPLAAAVQALEPRTIEPADPELFLSVNSHEDLEEAAAELRRRRRTGAR
jgi:molybdopterin-guanine dinucleotide biosynthesis protein A